MWRPQAAQQQQRGCAGRLTADPIEGRTGPFVAAVSEKSTPVRKWVHNLAYPSLPEQLTCSSRDRLGPSMERNSWGHPQVGPAAVAARRRGAAIILGAALVNTVRVVCLTPQVAAQECVGDADLVARARLRVDRTRSTIRVKGHDLHKNRILFGCPFAVHPGRQNTRGWMASACCALLVLSTSSEFAFVCQPRRHLPLVVSQAQLWPSTYQHALTQTQP
jgi:hypothetical protein